jgi:uncharacterized protein (DUF1697 family)
MPNWVALLRGINVSGQKPVPMERLRGSFASMGFRGVRTYVQSGNVVFETALNTRDALARKIKEGIRRDFGFSVVVIIRTAKELEKIVKKLSVGATTRNWKTTTVLCEMAVE